MLCACAEQHFCANSRPVEFGFLNLPANAEAFYQNLSKNRRSQLQRQKKAVFQSGKVEMRSCRSSDELETYIDALFDLHHWRRNALGDEGVFRRKPREAEFYRVFLPKAQKKGWLRIYGLFSEGALKAVQLGYVYNGAYYQIQEGFDPDFQSGAGNVLRLYAIEACIAERLTGYDFLAEMTVHKKRWSATPRFGSDIFIGKRSVKNALLFKSGIWPSGRYLRPTQVPP
jgi:CelD/BcsL family acetyltransferase involved in cellulose biosynthesis